jgi:hypothetical protein
MTNDDKALVERLFAMADEYDSGHHESWPTIDALEIAANRIEALSAEKDAAYQTAVNDIVLWLREYEEFQFIAAIIEVKFGGRDD